MSNHSKDWQIFLAPRRQKHFANDVNWHITLLDVGLIRDSVQNIVDSTKMSGVDIDLHNSNIW